MYVRFNYALFFIWVFSDFPTAPDFNEILIDGTVFYADSNGMFFSKNEKDTALQSYFSYLFVKKSKLVSFQLSF